jgi:FkbM family methyltransferase
VFIVEASQTASFTLADVAALYAPEFVEIIRACPIGVIDAGAQGGLGEPWLSYLRSRPGTVRTVGFEPIPEGVPASEDPDSARFFPHALWSEPAALTLHVAVIPTCSSIHPPNQSYNRTRTNPGTMTRGDINRETVRQLEVSGRPLDDLVAGLDWDLDVLKIDTQGAEFEILGGAGATLENVFAVVAETWTVPVHQGQALFFDVARRLHEAGFEFMSHELAGLLLRPALQKYLTDAGVDRWKVPMRRQVSSLELLYFRPTQEFVKRAASPARVIKAAGIADLYGYPDVGLELLEEAGRKWPDQAAACDQLGNIMAQRRLAAAAAPAAEHGGLYARLHV